MPLETNPRARTMTLAGMETPLTANARRPAPDQTDPIDAIGGVLKESADFRLFPHATRSRWNCLMKVFSVAGSTVDQSPDIRAGESAEHVIPPPAAKPRHEDRHPLDGSAVTMAVGSRIEGAVNERGI